MDLREIGRWVSMPFEFVGRHFKVFVFLAILVWIFNSSSTTKSEADDSNLAEISLQGPIFDTTLFLEQLERLEKLPNLKGVLLVVDSPGGAISPSVEIAEEVKRLSSRVPVVTYAQGVMASGSYYAGVWSNAIVANKGGLIGSIGVVFEGADVSELSGKLGIKSQTIKAGKYKEMGTFMRPWNAEERSELERLIQEQYQMFVGDVITARGLRAEDSGLFAEGRVFSAQRALDLGLIDRIGIKSDAKTLLVELSGVDSPKWLQRDPWEKYLDQWMSKLISQVSLLLSAKIF